MSRANAIDRQDYASYNYLGKNWPGKKVSTPTPVPTPMMPMNLTYHENCSYLHIIKTASQVKLEIFKI